MSPHSDIALFTIVAKRAVQFLLLAFIIESTFFARRDLVAHNRSSIAYPRFVFFLLPHFCVASSQRDPCQLSAMFNVLYFLIR